MWQSEADSVSATVANVQDVTNNTVSYGLNAYYLADLDF